MTRFSNRTLYAVQEKCINIWQQEKWKHNQDSSLFQRKRERDLKNQVDDRKQISMRYSRLIAKLVKFLK